MNDPDRSPPDAFDLVHDFVTASLLGELDANEVEDFEELLRDDAELRRMYACYLELTAQIPRMLMTDVAKNEKGTQGQREEAVATPKDLPPVAVSPASPSTDVPLPAPASPVLDLGPQGWGFLTDHTLLFSVLAVLILAGAVAVLAVRNRHLEGQNAAAHSELAERGPEASAKSPLPPVATLSRLCNVSWAGPRLALSEMARLAPGQDVKLDAGRAEINFDVGAQMVVEGPAHIRILDPLKIQAYSGNITARVGKSAHGFSVLTPQGKVVDFGTNFGLRIDSSGREDVAVFEGSVDVDYRLPTGQTAAGGDSSRSSVRRLVQGEGIQVGRGGNMTRLVAITNGTFPRQVQASPVHTPVITCVTDNLRRPDCKKFYEIVHGGLNDGAGAYVDWTNHTWGVPNARIPEVLRGADYVKTFNDDMERRDIEITVHLACAADLYVFIDDRARMEPPWLRQKFQSTGWKIVQDLRALDNRSEWVKDGHDTYPGGPFSVWRLSVPGPQDVKLGGTGQYTAKEAETMDPTHADLAMYGIAAVARPAASTPPNAKAPDAKKPAK